MSAAARRPRIAHVISDLGVGGSEMTLVNLAVSLAGSYDQLIVSLCEQSIGHDELRAAGVPVVTLGMSKRPRDARALARLTALLVRFAPDVVQGWLYHGNLAAWGAALAVGRRSRMLWNIRSTPLPLAEESGRRWPIRLGAWLYPRPAAVVFNSAAGERRHRELGYRSPRSELIPNGFDPRRWRPDDEARRRVRRELGLEEGVTLVGLIARYAPVKAHGAFLEAAAAVSRTHPDVVFLMAGSGAHDRNPRLAAEPARVALDGRLRLLGERRDIPVLTAALDVACLTSLSEGCPNVVGEAMACGVPCVVTDVGDAAHLLGGTGEVVPPRDTAAFASALARVLELGDEGRRRRGETARRRILEHFTLSAMVSRYDGLYRSVAHLPTAG
jgi:glycosyltransferase involved in cell wall biosynthesis